MFSGVNDSFWGFIAGPWKPLANLHVHSKNTHEFISKDCPCRYSDGSSSGNNKGDQRGDHRGDGHNPLLYIYKLSSEEVAWWKDIWR